MLLMKQKSFRLNYITKGNLSIYATLESRKAIMIVRKQKADEIRQLTLHLRVGQMMCELRLLHRFMTREDKDLCYKLSGALEAF